MGFEYWIGASAGDYGNYDDAANWSGGAAPGAATDVSIGNGASVQVSFDPLGGAGSPVGKANSVQIGLGSELNVSDATLATGSITNAGTLSLINGALRGAAATDSTQLLTNYGTVELGGGTGQMKVRAFYNFGKLLVDEDVARGSGYRTELSSTAAGVLRQGSYELHGKLLVTADAAIKELAGGVTLTLDGAGGDLSVTYATPDFGGTGPGTATRTIEQSLLSIDAGASLQLLDARGYGTTAALDVAGTLLLDGGTLRTGGLTVAAAAHASAWGEIDGGLTVAGTLTVARQGSTAHSTLTLGDTAEVASAIDGSGILVNNSLLTLDQHAAITTAQVNNRASVLADDGTSITGKLTNTGAIWAEVGTLTIGGAVFGAGSFNIMPGATLDFATKVASAAHVGFDDAGGTLRIGDPADFHATVSGFATGDAIELDGFGGHATMSWKSSADHTAGTIKVTDGKHSMLLHLAGAFDASAFHLDHAAGGELVLTYQPQDSHPDIDPHAHG